MLNKDYLDIVFLSQQPSPYIPRLYRMRKIIQKPDFRYNGEDDADYMVRVFLGSSYWLDKELLDEDYLYEKELSKQHTVMQTVHFQMVDIGALLLKKGFPLEWDFDMSSTNAGLNQLTPYAKTFAKQCRKRYDLFYKNQSVRHQLRISKDFSRTRD